VPVIVHNLSGCDSHLFVKIVTAGGGGNIDCTPNTLEKCISFSKSIYDDKKKFKYKIRFTDSSKFMSTSRDKLVNNLKQNQFNHMKQKFGEDCELLLG